MYDLQIEFPAPPVPRDRVVEIAERTNPDGVVVEAPDGAALAAVTDAAARRTCRGRRRLPDQQLRQPCQRAGRRRPRAPTGSACRCASAPSSRRRLREYPRMITTACNAATMPVIGPYLDELQKWLAAEGFGGSVLMMLSNGGVVSADDAARAPIRLVESGPAAGALAGSWFARRLGEERLLCFDMGGTTAKSCLITGGEPVLTTTFEVARMYRFKKGSGFPVNVPSVDLVEIGAGGGSEAWVDDVASGGLGLLKVGPQSAGADPGPACYGRGGDRADGHRRRRRARTARSRLLPRRRHAARRVGRRTRRSTCSPPPSAVRATRPRPGSPISSTRTWPRRAGCTPSSRAPTCAGSRCSPSAGPGRCTPAAWPSCSSRRGSCSR